MLIDCCACTATFNVPSPCAEIPSTSRNNAVDVSAVVLFLAVHAELSRPPAPIERGRHEGHRRTLQFPHSSCRPELDLVFIIA